jgi:hypothetical protein
VTVAPRKAAERADATAGFTDGPRAPALAAAAFDDCRAAVLPKTVGGVAATRAASINGATVSRECARGASVLSQPEGATGSAGAHGLGAPGR